MATTQANINIAVKGQQQITGLINSLDNLKAKTEKVNSTFASLKSVVGGLALGAVINNVLQFADSISDLSKTTGIAVQNLLGFQAAVIANGGNAEAATKGILKLVQSIDDAAGGSLDAQDAFKQVGVSLEDLRNLSEQDLLAKVIKGLESVDSVSKRVGLSNELLGKSFKLVDVKGLAGDYDSATAAAARHAAAVKAAGEVQDKLDAAFGQFRLSVLSALKPLADFLNTLKPEQINAFVDAIVKIGGAAVAITGLTKAFGFLTGVITTVAGVWAWGLAKMAAGSAMVTTAIGLTSFAWEATTAVVASLWSTVRAGAGSAISIFARLGALGEIILVTFGNLGNIFRLLAIGVGIFAAGAGSVIGIVVGISASLYSLASLIDSAFDTKIISKFTNAVSSAYDKFKNFLGLGKSTPATTQPGTSTAGAGRGGSPAITAQLQAQGEEMRKQSEAARAVTDALEKQRQTIRKASADFGDYTKELRSATDQEAKFVGMNQDQVDILKAQASIFGRAKDEVKKLEDAKAALSEKESALGVVYDEQIKKINEMAKVSAAEIAVSINGLQTKKLLEEDRIKNLENITKAIDDQISRSQTLGDILKNANDKLIDVNFDASIQGLGDAAKAVSQIREDNRKAALEAGRAFAAGFEGMDLTTAQSKELAAGLALIADRYKKIGDVQTKNYEQSRTFASGWKKAFNEYRDAATNAAKTAENVFNKFASGIEDMLVSFVKTGKFEWKSFVASMAEELLRSQIKTSLSNIMGMLSGGEGIMGSIGKLFGLGGMDGGATRGQSANTPMYVYDVAGGGQGGGAFGGVFGGGQQGGGGGIFSSIGNVFSGITDTISNIGSSIGNVFSGVTSGIGDLISGGGFGGGGGFFDSITSGFSSLFDGFFANGGNIGAGKFGVVGESGPEFVSGPASVTPMGGGGSVTYNINAVDAASFKALVAADPGFIHAVAQMGGRSVPSRR